MKTLRRFLKLRTFNLEPSSGFTLVELMVVLSIITVLTSILVGYSKQNSKYLLLSTTQARVLSIVSRAKFLSIETFFFQDLGGPGPSRKTCGYGVHVDTSANEIFIFQDRRPAMAGCPANNIWNPGLDARLTGELDSVKINPELMTLGGTLRNVVFVPPDPEVYINGPSGDESASIDITLVDTTGSFSVTVTNAGQVKAN